MTGGASTPQPQRIGRYEIEKAVGRGSMGVVYRARDTALDCTVALKTISLNFAVPETDQRSFEKRFVAEAQAVASLSHPGIVEVYDVGIDPETGMLFMALEYLCGKTLESVLAGGRAIDWHQALQMGARIADALHHAHEQGIIHRDIKPANIMVLDSGQTKIMDFGVAKFETADLSMTGQVFGSPSYMSPQQAFGEHLDGRTDIFSLGAVLYEMLTGKRAFGGADVPQILMKVVYQQPVPPSGFVAGLPRAVDGVIAKALAKKAEHRYPDAGAFRDDLDDLLQTRPPRHAESGPSPKESEFTTLAYKNKEGVPQRRTPSPHTSDAVVGPPPPATELGLPADKQVSLTIRGGGRNGEVFIFVNPKAVIGRAGGGAGADIELPDPQVSRAHVAVECYGFRIVLRDLGSTNGTFVHDERISEIEIENHTEFRVGRTLLTLNISARG